MVNSHWGRFKNVRVLYIKTTGYDDRLWLANSFANLQILCLSIRHESYDKWNKKDLTKFMQNNLQIKTIFFL